ncbi:MAG: DUF881 domain-containing protein [Firmicutes bacterium]|nr:DUF881 domain-containing protein [Bacillota bacterium]
MQNTETATKTNRNYFIIIIVLVILNIVLLAAGFYFINNRLTPEAEEFAVKQKMAKDLVDYNRRLAKNLGVDSRAQVREALSRFNYEIDLATDMEDLNGAIIMHGTRIQERILQEYEAKLRDTVLMIVNQDPQVLELEGKHALTIRLNRQEGVQVEPINLLTTETIQKIKDNISLGEHYQDLTVNIEVENGLAKLLVPLNTVDQIRSLTKEIDSLRVTVHDLRTQAGFAPMTGAGIIVKIYDKTDGYTNDAIIHETDVRDIVNELFAAGARGVAVGNQRLTVTSAIRCVGPSILVNDERIAVNPVVIQAIGDPDVLASGLDIIRITLQVSRELTLEIEKTDNLILPAFSAMR